MNSEISENWLRFGERATVDCASALVTLFHPLSEAVGIERFAFLIVRVMFKHRRVTAMRYSA